MPAAAPADPERFKEASDYFRAKTPVTREEWDAMRVEARRQSFTIAGTQQLEVVQTVMDSLQHAIDSGEGIGKWRAKIRDSLGKKFTEANASTLTTAFINANQTAYNTGRWHQMSSPAVTGALPWRKFDAILDGRETPFCHACAGTILPHDHPWWLTHWPQCHHRCRSTVRALSDRMAARAGGSTANPASPKRDGDWALAPPMRTGIWEPDANKYEQHAAREYVKKQRSMRDRERAAARPRYRKATPAEQPSTRLGAVGEKVFGRKISDRELDEVFGLKAKLPDGFKLSIASVTETKRETVRVVGAIYNDKDEIAGTLSRVFRQGAAGTLVEHDAFFINDAYQSLGLGRSVFNAQVAAYKSTGLIKTVELDAAQVGRYVWTKAGFEWSAEDKAAALGHLRDNLLTKVTPEAADKIMSKVKTPFDVSRVVVDGERVGKELLLNYPEDLIPMSQTPDKIKPL